MTTPIASTPQRASRSVVALDQGAAERKQAVYSGQLNPAVQGLYSLALIDTTGNNVRVVSADDLDPARRTANAEYFFTVPPKSHEMSEPFATTITATQNGGKFIESHGSILKQVRLSGTTGLRPNPQGRSQRNIPLFGAGIDQLASELEILSGQGFLLNDRNLPENEATGFDDIVFLRNIFRHYSDLKASAPHASNILMLWRNAKDADYWVVEPMEFKLSQEASSPLTYQYNIMLTTLARFTGKIHFPADPLADILAVQRLFSRIQEYTQSLKRAYLVIASQISRFEGFGVFAQNQLLSPIVDTIRGLGLIKNTTTMFGSRIINNAQKLFDNLTDAISKFEESPDVGQDSMLRLMRRLLVTAARILTEPTLRDNVAGASASGHNRGSQAYQASGGTSARARVAPATAGSRSFIGNESSPATVAQATVHLGEDIRGVASRLLGDRARWQTLVILNNLVAPYIGTTRSSGVLVPGDAILYPAVSEDGVSTTSVGRAGQSDNETDWEDQGRLGPIQQAYGRDIRLRSVDGSAGGVDLTDLAINQAGDISSIVGLPNVNQGLQLKFMTKRGELAQHPVYGAQFPIGSKATNVAFNEYRIQTEATLYSDTRVSAVSGLSFVAVHDVITVKAKVSLLNAADVLDTNIALGRL